MKPKRHVIRVSDLTSEEAREHGPLLRLSAAVVDFARRARVAFAGGERAGETQKLDTRQRAGAECAESGGGAD